MKKTTLIVVFAMLIGLSTSAFAIGCSLGSNCSVSGMDDIFAAVTGINSTSSSDSSGLAPVGLATGITGGTSYDFTAVSGTVNCSANGGYCGTGNTADGGTSAATGTNIFSPGNGISGIEFQGDTMFLVGVFINSSAPPSGTGPAVLNYGSGTGSGPNATGMGLNGSDPPTFQPLLNQTFFIGDGTEGYNGTCPGPTVETIPCSGGQLQTFLAPAGANELFLGFADGAGVQGLPGFYGDNLGAINVTVNQVTSTPEPGTMMLMGLGLAACALLRKKLA